MSLHLPRTIPCTRPFYSTSLPATIMAITILKLPREIRQSIWAFFAPTRFHIQLDRDRLFVSCCHPKSALEVSCTQAAREKGPVPPGRPLDERLATAWGPHWRCEEQQKSVLGQDCLNLSLTCKTMSVCLSHRCHSGPGPGPGSVSPRSPVMLKYV